MPRVLVWDLPTRLSHGLLTVGVLCAFAFAQFAGEHSSLFPFHSMLGVIVGLMVVLRIVWGFIGTRYARVSSFLFSPVAMIEYLKGVVTGEGDRYVGHNPGSSYAILLMLGLALVVASSGLLMSGGNEAVADIHSIAAYALIGVVIIHILGVIPHTIRHRENITLSMVTGMKDAEAADGISSAAPMAGGVFALAAVLLAGGLYQNYDAAGRRTKVPVIGTVIQLGEAEGEHGQELGSPRRDEDDD
jgi:cytochrome b